MEVTKLIGWIIYTEMINKSNDIYYSDNLQSHLYKHIQTVTFFILSSVHSTSESASATISAPSPVTYVKRVVKAI